MQNGQDQQHEDPWRSAADLRRYIHECFAGTQIPEDLAGTAAERVDPDILKAWFKMPLRPAAVLIPLTERDNELHMLLTERTHDLPDHPGQVSFPGGSYETSDADLEHTALRESFEEVGLHPEQVDVAGYLPAQAVITGFSVLPVVGFYDPDYEPVIDTREVGEVFEVPLNFLRNTDNLRRVDRERHGIRLATFEYSYRKHRIWGATALMIRQFIGTLENPGLDNVRDPRAILRPIEK